MTDKSLDRALDIVSVLINGGEIKKNGDGAGLYDEYAAGTEVYDTVNTIMKKFNISIYEYNYGLYITAGEGNRVFGYTNEELKKEIGVKLNRELYMCYFIMYIIMTRFYKAGNISTFTEYIKAEDVISATDGMLSRITKDLKVIGASDIEEGSFRELALTWEDMPMVITEENALRAGRTSKAGFVKLTFNFMVAQGLLFESDGRYYPKDRFKALMENYYDRYKGRLYEILRGGKENATDK